MIDLLLTALCLAQLAPLPYEQAAAQAEATGKPLLVIVQSADCPPCITMKREVLEPMATAGEFDGIIIATLSPGSVSQEMKVKMTPSLVGFKRRDGAWTRYRMDGRQSMDRVRQLVNRLRE